MMNTIEEIIKNTTEEKKENYQKRYIEKQGI